MVKKCFIAKSGGTGIMELYERVRIMWSDKLKELGVNIHVVATGAGAGIQNELWEIPGSSAYLSGASFPYDQAEQEELLGFMPEHFVSEEAAVDLASAAYMKAYKFGGKKPVGVGLTASVASEKIHRGEHRFDICIMTNDKVVSFQKTLVKGAGSVLRIADGRSCNDSAFYMLLDVLGISAFPADADGPALQEYKDNTELAKQRFFERPFFTANGKRLPKPTLGSAFALMPGAYNPPHEGHIGVAEEVNLTYHKRVVFEVTAEPPHKEALTVQQLLQRAKLLQGHDRLFTRKEPFYIDKARAFPKTPLILGADAMVRILDPKWGLDIGEMFGQLYELGTKLYVSGREIDGTFTTCENILDDIKAKQPFNVWASARIVMLPVKGEWNVSSTEIRNKSL
jgi:cytidylyltransferase-like protein